MQADPESGYWVAKANSDTDSELNLKMCGGDMAVRSCCCPKLLCAAARMARDLVTGGMHVAC